MDMERPEWLLQMEDILETLNEGVMILDDCRNILFINSKLEEMFGFPASEVVGRNGISFYTEDERKVMAGHIERGREAGQNRFEFVLPVKDGSRLPVIISSRAFRGSRRADVRGRDVYRHFRTETGRGEAAPCQ